MTNLLMFIIVSVLIGILFAIPGMVLGFWLEKSHKAPNRSFSSLFVCISAVFILRILTPDLSYLPVGIILILASTLGVYNMDIYDAWNKNKH